MALTKESLESLFDFASAAELLPFTMPRRYVVPTGFWNPKYHSTMLSSYLLDPGTQSDQVSLLNKILTFRSIDYLVPTYFVSEMFLRAVMATQPPKDFRLNEIFWPLPVMTFILPVDFMREYTGYDVPFLTTARVEKGDVGCKALKYLQTIEIPNDKMLFGWNVWTDDAAYFDYAGSFPLDYTIGDVGTTEAFTDYTSGAKKEILDKFAPDRGKGLTPEQDVVVSRKMYALGINLMLALTARPHMLEAGACVRKASEKHGRMRDELWSPNFIGAKYKVQRSAPQGGTHASPILHWRSGHYRNQPHGPGRTLRKWIPIEPVLIGAD